MSTDLKKMTRCIQCGQADLEPMRIELPGTVRGENYTVEMDGLVCPRGDYKTIEGTAMPEYGRLLADKYRAKHALLTSEELRARRKALGMNQREFARYVGVGEASIKRWEMGKIQDQRSNDIIRRKTDPVPHSAITWMVLDSTVLEPVGISTSADYWREVLDSSRTQATAALTSVVFPPFQKTIPAHLAALLIRAER